MPEPALKLSRGQRYLLAFLYAEHAAGGAPGYGGTIRWRTEGTKAGRASVSRALRRLERRGLLLRLNYRSGMGEQSGWAMRESKDDPHNRTTHVRLLPPGVEIGKRLSNDATLNVNRLSAEPNTRKAR